MATFMVCSPRESNVAPRVPSICFIVSSSSPTTAISWATAVLLAGGALTVSCGMDVNAAMGVLGSGDFGVIGSVGSSPAPLTMSSTVAISAASRLSLPVLAMLGMFASDPPALLTDRGVIGVFASPGDVSTDWKLSV